jgi:hypothetical protein
LDLGKLNCLLSPGLITAEGVKPIVEVIGGSDGAKHPLDAIGFVGFLVRVGQVASGPERGIGIGGGVSGGIGHVSCDGMVAVPDMGSVLVEVASRPPGAVNNLQVRTSDGLYIDTQEVSDGLE